MKLKRLVIVSTLSMGLMSCASVKSDVGSFFGYNDENYIPKDKVGEFIKQKPLKFKKTEVEYEKLPASRTAVISSQGVTHDKSIVEAYENYADGGEDYVVMGDNMRIYPYDKYNVTPFECSIGRVCTITLEKGEFQTGDYQLGKSQNWEIVKSNYGKNDNEVLTVKPRVTKATFKEVKDDQENVVERKFIPNTTNLIVTTNKRMYRFNLKSSNSGQGLDVSFYYPQETQEYINSEAKKKYESKKVNDDFITKLDAPTNINIMSSDGELALNTKYTIQGDNPVWTPTQVFNDSRHTVIELPKVADAKALPMVWVMGDNDVKEMVSPRYRDGYFILDGIFKRIYLISVKPDNKTQTQVEIINDDYK